MTFARLASWVLALAAFFAALPLARADEAKPAGGRGLAVVAADGATDAAWPLARAIYADSSLRPASIDDAHARVLAGESAPADAPELVSLAELRAGVKGDDAASREVLAAIAQRLSAAAIVVVFPGEPPSARVYDAATHAFDAARYAPDQASGAPTWSAALGSLERPYRPAKPPTALPAVVVAPPPAVSAPGKKSESKAFYESPWFWVAIGAAALIGGGILIGTSVQSGDTIHLQMRFP